MAFHSMKPQDDEPTSSGPKKPSKPSRAEEARRIVEEYANDLREILQELRKFFNWKLCRALSQSSARRNCCGLLGRHSDNLCY